MLYTQITDKEMKKSLDFKPLDEKIKAKFSANLAKLQDTDLSKDEEFQKNRISNFLRDTYKYELNTKGRIDLAIYDEFESDKIEVIFEAKSSSSNDFPENPTKSLISKALCQSVWYFMHEIKAYKNNNIKHIILCTFKEFIILDARQYYEFFIANKSKEIQHELNQIYENCAQNKGSDPSTNKFYNDLKEILSKIQGELKFYYVNLSELKNDEQKALFYNVLNPQNLLKQAKTQDANALNYGFYEEFLYILGLCEVKDDKNKQLFIKPSKTQGSFAQAIASAFDLDQEKDFDKIFALLILWSNRLLFLRLFEALLMSFKHLKEPFLSFDILSNFSDVDTLFFGVLAKNPHERNLSLNSKSVAILNSIPYLNSSLFEKDELEKDGFEIIKLKPCKLARYAYSVLGEGEDLQLLDYLFLFLRAYDFTTTPSDIKDGIKINHNKLINSSILGKIFEKLNGYKDGAVYTQSFITNYMCRVSLEKVVLDKFKAHKFKANSLVDLANEIEDRKNANEIFNSIKICDPAVGSGHFLVSALNELILLKFRLGILLDSDGIRLKDIKLEIQNDELLIINEKGQIHSYEIPAHENIETHRVQKAIFLAKQELIENCLFGVDINKTSCEISRLRLWIECLKYSFYKDIKTRSLETLPNIDINIKCGNSLTSYIKLDSPLNQYHKDKIKNYKNAVNKYKNLSSIFPNIQKSDVKAEIEKSKGDIIEYFKQQNKNKQIEKSLQWKIKIHLEFFGAFGLDDGLRLYIFDHCKDLVSSSLFEKTLNDTQKSNAKRSNSEILDIYAKLYPNFGFEWRLEFPEVLNDNGDFMGFDLVIGNPPYIDYREIDLSTKTALSKNSIVYKENKEGSIYVYFIEKAKYLLNKNGVLVFINPISYICQGSGGGIRSFIDENLTLTKMLDVSNINVFGKVATYTCINFFTHKNNKIKSFKFGLANTKDLNLVEFKEIKQCKIEDISVLLDSITTKIFNAKHPNLNEFCDIFCGLSKTFRDNVQSVKNDQNHPFLEAKDILRYEFKQGKFLSQIENYYSQERAEIFREKEVIFMARMTNYIRACIAPKGYFGGKVNVFHNFKIDKRYILGLLNSKILSYFYAKKYFASHMQGGAFGFDTISVGFLPIPKLNKNNENLVNKIINLVDEILRLKNLKTQSQGDESSTLNSPCEVATKNSPSPCGRGLGGGVNPQITQLESEINDLVYKLYDLTTDEIALIEN